MRQVFAHDAVLVMEPEADDRAPGAAIAVALCGHWDHKPPCPLSPHRVHATRVDNELHVRVLFAAEPETEGEVRQRIERALSGQWQFPDGFTTPWLLQEGPAQQCVGRRDRSSRAPDSPLTHPCGAAGPGHQSEFCQSNAVVVQGRAGVLLIEAGVLGYEMADLANDVRELGQPVVAGFSTHPHWDHLLWHAGLGSAPRYDTARCAATIQPRLSDPGWQAFVARLIPPDIVEQVPLDLLGLITGLPAEPARIPWDGPRVRILEHQAHAPGHGSIGGADQVRARIGQDRGYVQALRDAGVPDEMTPSDGTSAPGTAQRHESSQLLRSGIVGPEPDQVAEAFHDRGDYAGAAERTLHFLA